MVLGDVQCRKITNHITFICGTHMSEAHVKFLFCTSLSLLSFLSVSFLLAHDAEHDNFLSGLDRQWEGRKGYRKIATCFLFFEGLRRGFEGLSKIFSGWGSVGAYFSIFNPLYMGYREMRLYLFNLIEIS
jgi:hypothetical protein